MSPLPVGLVGFGFGGSVFHAPLILAEPRLHLKTIVTSRNQAVDTLAASISAVPSVQELLNDPEIQLVVVSSPSPTHFEIAQAALQAGKHVVVDKPFATTTAEANELIALAGRRGLFLSAFQNRRWDGDFLTVGQIIAQGGLGNIYYLESHFDRFRPQLKPGWKEEAVPGAGILYDLGAHLIDQALQLFGMPEAIAADVFPQREGARADDYFHLILHYGRLRAILHASALVCQPGPRFTVHGDRGSFVKFGMDVQEDALKAGQRPGSRGWGIEPAANFGELTSANGERQSIPILPGAYEHYYAGVAASILDGAPALVTPEQARDVILLIEAALRSSAEGRRIDLAS